MTQFQGTEQELKILMKEVLTEYMEDQDKFSLKLDDTQDEQLQNNMIEALAKCVDNGYIENLKYQRSINGHASFFHFNSGMGIPDPHPVNITDIGKIFLANY